jgi:hypothetical protein
LIVNQQNVRLFPLIHDMRSTMEPHA